MVKQRNKCIHFFILTGCRWVSLGPHKSLINMALKTQKEDEQTNRFNQVSHLRWKRSDWFILRHRAFSSSDSLAKKLIKRAFQNSESVKPLHHKMIHCLEELQSDRESFDSEQDFKMHLKSFDSDWYFGAWILNHFKSAEAGSLNFKLAQ